MTPAPNTDLAALFQGVLDSPRDPLPKLVLADYLDEHGEPLLAHAFRWCAAYGRHPAWRLAGGRRWSWCEASAAGQHPDCLPLLVLREVINTPRNFTTLWDAFAALADALEELAAVVRLPHD